MPQNSYRWPQNWSVEHSFHVQVPSIKADEVTGQKVASGRGPEMSDLCGLHVAEPNGRATLWRPTEIIVVQ